MFADSLGPQAALLISHKCITFQESLFRNQTLDFFIMSCGLEAWLGGRNTGSSTKHRITKEYLAHVSVTVIGYACNEEDTLTT